MSSYWISGKCFQYPAGFLTKAFKFQDLTPQKSFKFHDLKPPKAFKCQDLNHSGATRGFLIPIFTTTSAATLSTLVWPSYEDFSQLHYILLILIQSQALLHIEHLIFLLDQSLVILKCFKQ